MDLSLYEFDPGHEDRKWTPPLLGASHLLSFPSNGVSFSPMAIFDILPLHPDHARERKTSRKYKPFWSTREGKWLWQLITPSCPSLMGVKQLYLPALVRNKSSGKEFTTFPEEEPVVSIATYSTSKFCAIPFIKIDSTSKFCAIRAAGGQGLSQH